MSETNWMKIEQKISTNKSIIRILNIVMYCQNILYKITLNMTMLKLKL